MGNNTKISSKQKKNQEDEFLANYLSKQKVNISPVNYLQNSNYDEVNEENEHYNQDRSKWRIHF